MHPDDWRRPNDTGLSTRAASAQLVDPEDDLPSANYGGDFETTRIPNYDGADTASGRSGLDLLADPEPLPYVEPGASGRHAVFDIDPPDELDDRRANADRRGTQDLGLMLLRVVVGGILIAHGLQKGFGLWGGRGLGAFQDSLATMGYQHAESLTYLAAGTQITAGVLLVLGLFTPLAAAAALAYLVNSLAANIAVQHDAGYIGFFLPGGNEFQVLLAAAVVAVILVGPGRYGL
ncbi:MAG: putative oxidoreductase, partial [Mycobacterium sp.]|nr:putative oxidoreductase [Mycobacterium sp.]